MTVTSNTNSKKKLFALLSMLFGAVLMMVIVVFMNQFNEPEEQKQKNITRVIEMQRTQKQQSKPKPKPKPKPQKPKAAPKAPLPSIASALSGIDMGIPEFAVNDIAGDASSLLGDIGQDTIMSEASVDVKPKVSSRAALEYPRMAMKKNIKGYVLINILIDEQGNVEVAQVLEGNPTGVFDNAALESIKQWRFSPAQYKGRPVKVWAKQKIRFDFN